MKRIKNKIYDIDGVEYLLETTADPVIKQLCERYINVHTKLNDDNYSTIMKVCTNYISIINYVLDNEKLVKHL